MSNTDLKIICVEDEPPLLEMLAQTVRELGFDPIAVPDGRQALDALQKDSDKVVLVLSDIMMPDMNGFELRAAMLPQFKQIPTVFASGQVSREEALSAVDLKVSAFVDKPYSHQAIKAVLQRESADRVAQIRDDEQMLEGFVVEARSLTEEMEHLILSLESDPTDQVAINRIFACAHTIKGTSSFFRPDTVHRFTHRYEDFFSQFKKDPGLLTPASISTLLKGLDTIKQLIEDLAQGGKGGFELEALLEVFKGGLPGPVPRRLEVAPPSQAQAPTPKAPAAHHEEIRIGIEVLNRFMEKSGELTVLRNMVNKIIGVIETNAPNDPNVAALSDLLVEMHKVNGYLQDHVVELRKVALRQVYKPLARTVRDLTVGLKKKISFITSGDDLRIDHTIAEALNKCLPHLIRNSADHGLEGSEERARVKKDPTGKIQISASETSEEVVVRIQDDGRGIDPVQVRRKAVQKGLITEGQGQAMSDSDLQCLIFEPGFSTAEKVTDVSGRGVGTDMVKSTIQGLGGHLELISRVGVGTEFVLHLPIPRSVLIINSLLVRARGRTFAIPQESIRRITRSEGDEKKLGDSLVLETGDALLPILDLAALLELETSQGGRGSRLLIHLTSAQGDFCLAVDEVIGIEDTVVRHAGPWLKTLTTYLGATFLADGGIGLILDTDGIAAKQRLEGRRDARSATKDSAEGTASRADSEALLLVDLGTPTQYGTRQSEIVRLEVFSPTEIQYSGGQPMVVYRGHAMPLLALRRFLAHDSPSGDPERFDRPVQVLVVEAQGISAGFVVDQILDFVEGTPTDRPQIRIVNNRSVTVLDLKDTLLRHGGMPQELGDHGTYSRDGARLRDVG